MKKVLIITSKTNKEVEDILAFLPNSSYLVIYNDVIHTQYSFEMNQAALWFEIIHQSTQETITSDNLQTIWYANEENFYKEGIESDEPLAGFFAAEYQQLLHGIMAIAEALDILVVNKPHLIQYACEKTRQMIVAKQVGMTVPQQVITNRKKIYLNQSWSKKAVVKPIHSSNLIEKDEENFLAKPLLVTEEIYNMIKENEVGLTLHHFQEKLDFVCEYRVVVFDNKVYAFRIEGDYIIDWRDHLKEIQLSYEKNFVQAENCLAFTNRLQISLGSFDFIQTKDGIYFIECNAPGYFSFCDIENQSGMLSDFAAYLMNGAS